MANIYSKLAAVQTALKAPKSQYNSFGNYNYRKAEDILEAVKPLLREQGLALTCTDQLVCIEGRHYVQATAIIYDTADGSSVSTTAYAREEESKKGMDGSQVTGASSSYARKYALNGLLCIDDTADSDTTNTGDNAPSKPQQKKATAKTAKEPVYRCGLTQRAYMALVAAVAEGRPAKGGGSARDAFINNCKPTPQEIDDFDSAVFDYEVMQAQKNLQPNKQ